MASKPGQLMKINRVGQKNRHAYGEMREKEISDALPYIEPVLNTMRRDRLRWML